MSALRHFKVENKEVEHVSEANSSKTNPTGTGNTLDNGRLDHNPNSLTGTDVIEDDRHHDANCPHILDRLFHNKCWSLLKH